MTTEKELNERQTALRNSFKEASFVKEDKNKRCHCIACGKLRVVCNSAETREADGVTQHIDPTCEPCVKREKQPNGRRIVRSSIDQKQEAGLEIIRSSLLPDLPTTAI